MSGMVQQNIPGQRPVSRVAAILPVQSMTTYGIQIPKRRATCEEVACPHYLNGWATTVIQGGPDEAAVRGSGRKIASAEQQPGGFVRFTFSAGQPCFATTRHRVAVERGATFYKRGGDWRATTSAPVTMRPADWVDDFANHQQALADKQQEG